MTSSTRKPVALEVMNLFTESISMSSRSLLFSLVSFVMIWSFLIAAAATAQAATAPSQPTEGPGGSDYAYSRITSSVYGRGDLKYYLYEPAGPKPETAPLIVFTHGWGGTNPSLSYGAWIKHLVRKGNIVVYPVYQSAISMLNGSRYTSNCVKAVLDAIQVLESEGHVKPDLDKFATVGHSVGGVLAANIAAVAKKSGLPAPKAVMSVEPGNTPMPPLEDLSLIPQDALLITVVGDKDTVVGCKDAQKIFTKTSQIPLENKDYIMMVSDNSGTPNLTANHFAPTCWAPLTISMPGFDLGDFMPGFGSALSDSADDGSYDAEALGSPDSSGSDMGTSLGFGADALDYYGTWKLFDALTDAAFYGKNREYALGDTPQQRFMGNWSNGKPVNELIVTDDPESQPWINGRRDS
ncbi:MAG: alpha/beta hydrolase fold domain-containing protein, partial [bacterium]